jgi:hypothetical protein
MKELLIKSEFVESKDRRLLSIKDWNNRLQNVVRQIELGQCFKNSYLLMNEFREGIEYVEGWCLSPYNQALDHAWNYVPSLNLMLDLTAEFFYTSFAKEYHPFWIVKYNQFTDFANSKSIVFKSKKDATYLPLHLIK